MRKPLPYPNKEFVPVPNEYFDVWQKELNPSQTKILDFIVRKTLGYQKQEDWISNGQIEEGTNLSRPTVIEHLKQLVEKEMIFRREEGTAKSGIQKIFYKLNIEQKGGTGKETLLPSKIYLPLPVKKYSETSKESLPTKYNTKDNNTNVWIKDFFSPRYQQFTNTAYTITFGKDNNIVKNLLRRVGDDVQKLNEITDSYFKWWASDKFWKEKSPDLQLFSSKLNDVDFFSSKQKPKEIQEYISMSKRGVK